MKTIVTICVAFCLASCGSTGIVPTDKGVYMIAKTSASGVLGSPDELTVDLYIEANKFCAKSDQVVETVYANPVPGVAFVRPASSSLSFRCVPK